MGIRIRYRTGDKTETRDFVADSVVIGRAPQSGPLPDLELTDTQASRPHARIWRENGALWIADLASKHGTIVGGRLLAGPARLEPRVPVILGTSEIMVVPEVSHPPGIRAVHVRISVEPKANYAMLFAGVPMVTAITLLNGRSEPIQPRVLELTLPGFASSSLALSLTIPSAGEVDVDAPMPRFGVRPHAVEQLTEPYRVSLEARLDGEPIAIVPPIEVEVLPAGAFDITRHMEVLPAFVLKESRRIKEVAIRARAPLRALVANARGFNDIPYSDARSTTVARAFYYCLQEQYAIAYGIEPRTYDPNWQKVRFPSSVLGELEGTCIDLALLFAACLEREHVNPVVVICGSGILHALVGWWRRDSCLDEIVTSDESKICGLIAAGELQLMDAVGFSQSRNGSGAEHIGTDARFGDACEQAGHYLQPDRSRRGLNRLFHAVDIARAREQGLQPLPLDGGWIYDVQVAQALRGAFRAAAARGDEGVTSRDLFAAMLTPPDSLMRRAIGRRGADIPDRLIALASESRALTPASPSQHRISRNLENLLRHAESLALRSNSYEIGEADVAYALCECESGVDALLAHRSLQDGGLSRITIRQLLDAEIVRGPIAADVGSLFAPGFLSG